jgi:hypothetical protein
MSKRFRNRFERSPRDFYPTPLVSVKPLIPHLKAAGVRDFAEPCVGQGDLVRHLESFGLRCVYRGDIETGQDALDIPRFAAPVITNTPFDRPVLLPLLEHFIRTAPSVWLILPADFAHVAYARPWLEHCSAIVAAGRAAWFGGGGTENVCWYRFESIHKSGPIFHAQPPPRRLHRTATCQGCSMPFQVGRGDTRYCSNACRQAAYRERRAVTEAVTATGDEVLKAEAAE